jgi:hypothetical protein
MGQGYSRVINYLDVGPERKESDLKKGKYARVLTSKECPKKPLLFWKALPLDRQNDPKTAASLKEGVHFIHSSRLSKQNTLVLIQPDDPDSIVFVTAYIMALSGFSAETASLAMENAVKDLELPLKRQYINALRIFRSQADPKTMRAELFKTSGIEPLPELTEDLTKIYSYIGRPKPIKEQIELESIPVVEQKPVAAPPKPISGEKAQDLKNTQASATKPMEERTLPGLEANKPSTEKEKELKPQKPPSKTGLTKEERVFVDKTQTMQFDDTTLVSIPTVPQAQEREFLPGLQKSELPPHRTEEVDRGFQKAGINEPKPKEEMTPPGLGANKPSTEKEKELKPQKPPSKTGLTKEERVFVDKTQNMQFDDTTLVSIPTVPQAQEREVLPGLLKSELPPHRSEEVDRGFQKVISNTQPKKTEVESRLSPSEMDDLTRVGQNSAMNHDFQPGRGRIQIIKAIGKDPADDTKEVDDLLAKTTAEERNRYRSGVTIVRAYEKLEVE